MKRVTGIGEIFLKARDPGALRAWYREHLEDCYCPFMQDWEARMNHYLRHGSALVGVDPEQRRMEPGA